MDILGAVKPVGGCSPYLPLYFTQVSILFIKTKTQSTKQLSVKICVCACLCVCVHVRRHDYVCRGQRVTVAGDIGGNKALKRAVRTDIGPWCFKPILV